MNIIFKKVPFKKLLNEDGTFWKDIDSLVNYVEESDLAIMLPIRYLEHLTIIKAWYVLAESLINEVVEEDLICAHIHEAKYLFP